MTNTKKTIISGVPRQFSETELKNRQDKYRFAYLETSQCCKLVRGHHPLDIFEKVESHINLGFVVSKKQPITVEPLNYSVWMIKPQEEQQVDLSGIDAKIKAEYIAELEKEHTDYKQRLYEQLVEAEERKQAAKEKAAKEKVYAELKKQAETCYTPLQIPE